MSRRHSCRVFCTLFLHFHSLRMLRGVLWGLACVRESVRAGTCSPMACSWTKWGVSIKHSSKCLASAACPQVRHSFVFKATVISIKKACKELGNTLCAQKREGGRERGGGKSVSTPVGIMLRETGRDTLLLSVFWGGEQSPVAVKGKQAGAGRTKETL